MLCSRRAGILPAKRGMGCPHVGAGLSRDRAATVPQPENIQFFLIIWPQKRRGDIPVPVIRTVASPCPESPTLPSAPKNKPLKSSNTSTGLKIIAQGQRSATWICGLKKSSPNRVVNLTIENLNSGIGLWAHVL